MQSLVFVESSCSFRGHRGNSNVMGLIPSEHVDSDRKTFLVNKGIIQKCEEKCFLLHVINNKTDVLNYNIKSVI